MPPSVPNAAAPTRMPARYFALLCELLAERGVAVEAMLENSRIRPTEIHGPDATLSVKQMEALVAAARATTHRDDLGIALGPRIKLSSHEILGYGILTSPTLDYALQLAARYYRLITPTFTLHYERGRTHSELRFQPALRLSAETLLFMLQTTVVSSHEQLKSLAPRLPAYDIYVSFEEPRDLKPYRDLKPARFHFGDGLLPGARMRLDNDVVAQPLPMADRTALKMAEARCEELLRRTAQTRGMTEWVTMMLREAHDGFPSLEELAHLLHVAPRTLERQLRGEGHRFLDLSRRIRHQKACELLATSPLSITQVAYHLGYREGASLSRAFRREAGMSPAAYREHQGRS